MKTIDYQYALSLTSQFYFCGMPFRLDITPKCEFNCLYCFAMSRGGKRSLNTSILNYKQFERKIVKNLKGNSNCYDINGEFLRHRQPIHFGGMSDPFSTPLSTSISIKCIKLLNSFNYPVLISTKNTDVLKNKEINNLINNKNIAIQISFSCFDDEKAKKLEPNVPLPSSRLKSINELSKGNIYIIARIQPLIYKWLEEIQNQLVSSLAKNGCKHIITEFLKIPVEKHSPIIKKFISSLNWDVYKDYNNLGAELIGREWILPNKVKLKIINPLIEVIHAHGMTYSCGDYGLNHIGDTKCCCGIDNIPGFENWFKGNFSNILNKNNNGKLDVEQLHNNWFPNKSITRIVNSNCRIKSKNLKDYLVDKWNRPGTVNSIDSYYGYSLSTKTDKIGNAVYEKN